MAAHDPYEDSPDPMSPKRTAGQLAGKRWLVVVLAALVLLGSLPWSIPEGTLLWKRAFPIHFDVIAIRTASASGDAGAYSVLTDKVANVPQDRVADDSRQAIAEALSTHLGAVVNDTSDGTGDQAAWKHNLFKIAELNQDETVNRPRARMIMDAVEAWLVTTMAESENNRSPIDRKQILTAGHCGNVYALALVPQLTGVRSSRLVNDARKEGEKRLLELVLDGAIVYDPGILPEDVTNAIAAEGGMAKAEEAFMTDGDPQHPHSTLGRHLAEVADRVSKARGDNPMSRKEEDVIGKMSAAGESFTDYLADSASAGR